MAYAVVRVRGHVNINVDIKYTMKLLNLTRINHCVIVPNTTHYNGMLQKVKDYVTWGEIEQDVLVDMIKQRGQLKGGAPVTDKYIKAKTNFSTIKDLSKAVVEETVAYKDIPDVKPIFRLHPPRKGGYEGIKRSFTAGGALGYREKEINNLLRRMI